jgi:hypothetical protein
MVGGEVVVADGGPTRVDEREMLAQAREHGEAEAALIGDAKSRERLEGLVESVYQRAEAYETPVNAYIPS